MFEFLFSRGNQYGSVKLTIINSWVVGVEPSFSFLF